MTIKQGDFVRPINTQSCLPLGTVWLVVYAEGGLKLEPFNQSAKDVGPLGTSPRRAPSAAWEEAPTSATYKPAHGGYPG